MAGPVDGVDWFEVITENFLVEGGNPRRVLREVRKHTPIVLHGVSLSIGSPDPLDEGYLAGVAALAREVEPPIVSDHLCWTSLGGHNTHDLLPLPYTDEALVHEYCRAFCVVLPSVYRTPAGETKVPELLGQTLLEGMACGAATVCTRVASMPEIVDDGVTGFIVPPNDPSAIGERLAWLAAHRDRAAAMGAAGRARVLRHFTWPAVVSRNAITDSIIARSAGSTIPSFCPSSTAVRISCSISPELVSFDAPVARRTSSSTTFINFTRGRNVARNPCRNGAADATMVSPA